MCNGQSGSLTAKAARKKEKINAAGAIKSAFAIKSGTPTTPKLGIDAIARVLMPPERNTAKTPTSIRAPPERVNNTNFIAEYRGRPLPHIEISMNIGITSNSKNTKNSNKSRLTNTPITADSSNSNQMKYSASRRLIDLEANVAPIPNSPVSNTNGALSPSTPIRYDDLSVPASSQETASTICTPPRSRSYITNTANDRTNATIEPPMANQRTNTSSRRQMCTNHTTSADNAGANTVRVSMPLNSLNEL